jgi:hypothetical protein
MRQSGSTEKEVKKKKNKMKRRRKTESGEEWKIFQEVSTTE